MSRIAIFSDIHAGLGANQKDLRELQRKAVRNATAYTANHYIDTLILNGDTTDHLANKLDAGTNIEIAREVMSPVVQLIQERRESMKTIVHAGNTDWVLADHRPHLPAAFFASTGLRRPHVTIPEGALLTTLDEGDDSIVVTHGHAMKPAQWGHEGPMTDESYARLLESLRRPSEDFLADISAVTGSHRTDYLKALAVGSVVKLTPRFVRERVNEKIGDRYSAEYEKHFGGMLAVLRNMSHRNVLGVMGHTHVARVREYDGTTIINTGTTGAKPNPLQRVNDPKGHIAIIYTDARMFELIQTYNAARPHSMPETVAKGVFRNM